MRLRLRSKSALAIFMIIALIAAVGTTAFFADRASHQITFSTATFTQDGYSLSRTASVGPFVAGEDVTFTLKETNAKSEDITSVITMHVTWVSPDKTSNLFSDTNKAEITVAGNRYDYPSCPDNSLSLVVSEHVLSAGATAETPIVIHVPESLKSTGDIIVTFEKVLTRQYPSGFSCEYNRDELNAAEALDFTARVGWAAAKTSFSVQTEKAIMAYLVETDAQGSYGITFEMSFGYTKSPMKDFSSADATPWSQYATQITNLSLCDGMTTIGDYAFSGFEGVTSVIIPNTVTSIGEDAFSESGLIGEVTIPKTVKEIKTGAFSGIFADTFTFKHGTNDALTLPDAFLGGGAFYYVGSHPNEVLVTTVNTDNLDIKYGYKWHDDLRRGTPVLAKQDTWYTQGNVAIDKDAITSIEIKDYYEPASYAYTWDASEKTYAFPNTVTAYLEETSAGSGTYKLTIAGNGYGCVIANKDSSDAFADFSNMKSVIGTSVLSLRDTGFFQFPATTTLAGMFYSCNALESIDVSTWDVSSVQDTSWMFAGCNAVKTLDLSSWETDSLTKTEGMFNSLHEAAAGVLQRIDLTGWNTANVTNMSSMFHGRPVLTEIKGLSGFNTAKVKDMSSMFSNCYALPNIDLSGFSTVLVQNMREMFRGCRAFTALDLSHFSTTGITSTDNLKRFASGCTSLTTITFGTDFGQAGKIPAEGVSSGMFYVSDYLKTNIINANDVMKVGTYDWITENRWKIGIIDAELSYDDVLVGETVDAHLDLLPENHDPYQSIHYEVLTGGQYAKVNKDTGVVTGLKAGTATVRVTIVDANGETISADGTVRVYNIGITKATLDYDDVQVGETVDPQLSLFPIDHDDCQRITYEVISGSQYAKVDENTGVVTGLKPGEATIRVTIIDANGDEVTADGTVTVYAIGITNATLKYDDVRVNETVDPQLTVLPTNRDPDKSKTYAIIAGSEYAKVNASTGVVTGLKPGTATVRVTIIDANGMQVTANANVKVYAVGATSATLAYNDVRVGKTVDPQSQILPADREPDKSVTYTVLSGTEYAKIDASSGVVTGLKPGTATIRMTVIDANGKTVMADGPVKVYAIGAASATLTYNDVQVGKTVDPKYSILPTDRDPDKSMTFSILSGDTYAKVDPFTGVVTGLTPGTATVRLTVTDANGDKITADGTVKVYAIGVTDASLAYNDVRVGETVSAQLQITPAQRDPDKSMTYSLVSGSEYAKVDASTGIVTGLKPGTATVRVTIVDANSHTVTADGPVKVYAVGVTSATLSYADVNVGKTVNPQTQIQPSDRDPDQSVTYTVVSGGEHAKVDASTGVVTGLKAGTATIRLTVIDANGNPVTADATVKVLHPIPILAKDDFWYSQGTSYISKELITSITIVDEIDADTKAAAAKYWDASDGKVGTVHAYAVLNGDGTTYTLTVAGNGYGCIYANKSSRYAFADYDNLTEINGTDILNTSNVTSMYFMFGRNYALSKTPDVGNWDTSKVTDMGNMFYFCETIMTPPNTTNWDTALVEEMNNMFYGCYMMETPPETGNWDMGNVFALQNMFHSCYAMTSAPNTANWDTSSVIDTYNMFHDCNSMETAPVTTNWDVGLLDCADYMFNNCSSMAAPPDTSNWDTKSLVSANYMFAQCDAMTTAPVTTNWNTKSLESTYCMFIGCESMITPPDMSKWDLSSMKKMYSMFNSCEVMKETPDMRAWDTSNIEDMSQMFYGCEAISSLDVSSFDTHNCGVDGLNYFAAKCYNLTTIILGPNFGQEENIPIPGSIDIYNNKSGGLFYTDYHSQSMPLNTYVIGANEAMMAYDWLEDYRGYKVYFTHLEGGDLTTNPKAAINGIEVTLAATPDDGFIYAGATMTYEDQNGNTQTVELAADELTFIMPASNVTITPKWEAI